VELIGVELADGVELAAPVEKGATGTVEKAAVGSCVGEACGGRET
jgi:hypothetical protein